MAGYGTDAAFTAWLAESGLSLPVGAPVPAILRQRGSAYIDGLYGSQFSGVPTGGFQQERAWPRAGATAYKAPIPDDVIPLQVEHASYFAAFQEATEPGSLAITTSAAKSIKRKKIDVIETEYFEGSGNAVIDGTLRLSTVEGLLAPFLIPETQGQTLGLWAVG